MNTGDSSNNTASKKWIAFDKMGAAILVVFALALTVYGFIDPSMFGGQEEEVVTEAEASVESAEPVGKAAAAQPKKMVVPVDDEPPDSGVLAARSANAQGQNRGGGSGVRAMNMRTLYLGENDWNFIGVITLRFIVNMVFAYILVCLIFSKKHRVKEYSFSYYVSNILIFMVTSLLASVRVRQGFAFGLFAILSILRFRTEQLQVREMTFLFAALILGVINSLATDGLSIFAILWANVILCVFVYICDQYFINDTDTINLVYDNTKLLAKDRKKERYDDIKNRFGYDVVKVVVMEMNYLTDSAKVKLSYKLSPEVKR